MQAAFMFYHKWIPRMIMKTQVFPCLSQIKAYASIFAVPRLEQCDFFFVKLPLENSTWFRKQTSFKYSAVVTGCFQTNV